MDAFTKSTSVKPNCLKSSIIFNASLLETTLNKGKIIELASHEKCLTDKKVYAKNFALIETESNSSKAATIIQQYGNKRHQRSI